MKKQSLLQRWLQNGYVLFAFALVISLVIWIYMSFNSPNIDTTFTLGDIPIQVELSKDTTALGLQVFTAGEPKATVTVSGNRTVLGMVDEKDVIVTAAASSINSSGNFTIPVSATKRTNSSNFQITSSTPTSVNITVDYLKESDFPIQDGVVYYVEDGYYGTSSLEYSSVTISGPQTEILKIKKVVAKASISGKLKESRETDATIVLLDENDNELSKKLLKLSVETLKANVTVLPEKTVKIEPVFINKPEGLELTSDMISITPSELLLAGPEDTLKTISSVQLEPIDFATVRNQKLDFDNLGINIPENCKSISNSSTAKVTLNFSSFMSKTFTVEKFTVEGLGSSYTSEVTSKSIDVTVIGSKTDIEKLTASQITAVIDTSTASGKTGSVEMPVSFRFSGVTSCWAYGSYQANVTINKKTAT